MYHSDKEELCTTQTRRSDVPLRQGGVMYHSDIQGRVMYHSDKAE